MCNLLDTTEHLCYRGAVILTYWWHYGQFIRILVHILCFIFISVITKALLLLHACICISQCQCIFFLVCSRRTVSALAGAELAGVYMHNRPSVVYFRVCSVLNGVKDALTWRMLWFLWRLLRRHRTNCVVLCYTLKCMHGTHSTYTFYRGVAVHCCVSVR